MKKVSKGKATGALNFLISCIAACLALLVAVLAARGAGNIYSGADLVGYSADTGALSFFGETLMLPKEAVNRVLAYPAASVEFTLGFLPQCARELVSGALGTLRESFCTFVQYISDAIAGFLRLGF